MTRWSKVFCVWRDLGCYRITAPGCIARDGLRHEPKGCPVKPTRMHGQEVRYVCLSSQNCSVQGFTVRAIWRLAHDEQNNCGEQLVERHTNRQQSFNWQHSYSLYVRASYTFVVRNKTSVFSLLCTWLGSRFCFFFCLLLRDLLVLDCYCVLVCFVVCLVMYSHSLQKR